MGPTPTADIRTALTAAGGALQALMVAASGDAGGRLAAARRFRAAADALRPESGSIPALAAVVERGGPDAAPAVRLLAAIGTAPATACLLAATGSGDFGVSQGALQALSNIEPGAAAAELLVARWREPLPPGAGFLLARAIAQQPGRLVLAWAREVLDAPLGAEYIDPVLRGIAARREPEVDSWLDSLAAAAKRPELKTAAWGAQLRSGDARNLDALVGQATAGKPGLRGRALTWLCGAPFAAVEAPFAAALTDTSAALRQAALLNVAFVTGPTLIPKAAALLGDPKPAVVHQAQAVYWLLTGSAAPTDTSLAVRESIQVAARLPANSRSLKGQPLTPPDLVPLLADASYAACADAALGMMVPQAPQFRPDCDLIRNLDALAVWQQQAQAFGERAPPGSRLYRGEPV